MIAMRRITPAITIRETDRGRGVFAARRYRRGEIVGDVCGTIVPDDTAERHGSRYCMELGEGRALEPEPPFCFVNHSCEPNCEIYYDEPPSANEPPDRLWLRTLRVIDCGEELTIDYAWPAEWAIPCRCGSERCRGWIVAPEEQFNHRGTENTETEKTAIGS
jgi:SET domain-containing protein